MSPNAKVKLAFKKKVLELDSHYESSYLSSLRKFGLSLTPNTVHWIKQNTAKQLFQTWGPVDTSLLFF